MGSYGKVPEAVIRRMPKYYRYLSDKLLLGEERISSSRMSEELGMNASQIRRDLNYFGGFGQQGYGYSIGKLRDEIAAILGLDQAYGAVILARAILAAALVAILALLVRNFGFIGVFDMAGRGHGRNCGADARCAISRRWKRLRGKPHRSRHHLHAQRGSPGNGLHALWAWHSGYLEFCTDGCGSKPGCAAGKCAFKR